jgi:cyclopropane-fatty-acyl-phospholipid synthase
MREGDEAAAGSGMMAAIQSGSRAAFAPPEASPRVRSVALLRVLGALVTSGTLTVRLPGGDVRVLRGERPGPAADVIVRRTALFRRLLADGALGLAEGYMAGEFDSPDPAAFLEFAARNADAVLSRPAVQRVRSAAQRLWELTGPSSRVGAVPTMRRHYDLGNEFYALWLDASMTYSSAVFERPDEPLEEAQARKYLLVAGAADLKPGHRVLETGTGWGSFAVFAARERGCRVTTITISPEQAAHARRRAQEAGVADRVDVQVRDYREIEGIYDRAVSIEMIESIDERQWPGYLQGVSNALVPGGRFGLQSITMSERHFQHHLRHRDFVMTYIFPGGRCPSPSVLRRLTAEAGFRWMGAREIGPSYALTLAKWRRRFEAAGPAISGLGFDVRFRRMWRYYLAYCEAGFRTGWTGDLQLSLEKR